MKTYDIHVSQNNHVLEIVFDKPKVNAICAASSRELGELFLQFQNDANLRVAIFTTAGGRVFSGGWDLKAAEAGEDYLSDPGVGGWWGFTEMPGLLKPVIVAINGDTVGAAFEMLTRADFVISADNAEFWLPEVFRGIPPEIASYTLPRQLPRQKAMEMLMTGKRFSASELETLGMINQVVAQEEVMIAAREFATGLSEAAPLALAAIKEVAEQTEQMTLEQYYKGLRNQDWPAIKACLESDDFKEGVQAFNAKRPSQWKGK